MALFGFVLFLLEGYTLIFKLIYYSEKKSPNLRLNGDFLYGKPNKQKSNNNMTLELPQQSILQKGTFVFEGGHDWQERTQCTWMMSFHFLR